MTNKRRLLNAMLPLLIVFFVSIITILSYLMIVTRSIWNQSVADILEVTDQGRHAFDTYISKESELIHYLSLQYMQMDSTDENSIQNNLNSLNKLKPDYYVIDLENEKVFSNHPFNIIKGKFDAYTAEQGCVINQPDYSDFSGVLVLSCYEVFRFKDKTLAMVQSEHKIDDIVDEFSLSFYGDEGFSNIINSNGKILIRSNNINDNRTFGNIFDIIDQAGNPEEDIKSFKNDLYDYKSGAMRFYGQDGTQYVYTYVPLKNVPGWYFVSIIPNSVLMQYTRNVLVTPELIIFSVAFCLVIIAVLVIEWFIHNKTIARKEKESEFLMTFISDLSESTNAVFIMLDVKDHLVEYVSNNTERMLGVPSKSIKTDLLALDVDTDKEGAAVHFDLLKNVTTDQPISIDITRVHNVSGQILALRETIYRITGNDTEHLLILIAERKKLSAYNNLRTGTLTDKNQEIDSIM